MRNRKTIHPFIQLSNEKEGLLIRQKVIKEVRLLFIRKLTSE